MFEEPEDNESQRPFNPADRAKDKTDEFRMHAELAAIFEAHRKFDAQILPNLDPQVARDTQKTIGLLERSRHPDTPVILDKSVADAAKLLDLPSTAGVSTNDYHIY